MALSDIRFTDRAYDPEMPFTTGFGDEPVLRKVRVFVSGARLLNVNVGYCKITLASALSDARDAATRAADAQLLKDLTRLRLGGA